MKTARIIFYVIILLIYRDSYMMDSMDSSEHTVSDLFAAAASADIRKVNELVDAGIPVNSVNLHGFTPLHVAASRAAVTEFINVYGPPTVLPGDHAVVVEFLLQRGAQPDAQSSWWGGCTALYWAARYGDAAILRLLIFAGANIFCAHRDDNSSVLHQAARSWDIEKVRVLVGAGANPSVRDSHNQTAADVAESTLISRYLMYRAQPTQNLFRALNNRNEEEAKGAIMSGADISVQNRDGDTPLHIAVRNGMVEFARMLTTLGPDISVQNRDGERPFNLDPSFWFHDVLFTGTS